MALTFLLPVLQTLPVPRHTAQHLPRHRLHAGVHLLLFAAARRLHGLPEEAVDLLKVHLLQVLGEVALLLRAQLFPELQQVRLAGFGQPGGESAGVRVHGEKCFWFTLPRWEIKKEMGRVVTYELLLRIHRGLEMMYEYINCTMNLLYYNNYSIINLLG